MRNNGRASPVDKELFRRVVNSMDEWGNLWNMKGLSFRRLLIFDLCHWRPGKLGAGGWSSPIGGSQISGPWAGMADGELLFSTGMGRSSSAASWGGWRRVGRAGFEFDSAAW